MDRTSTPAAGSRSTSRSWLFAPVAPLLQRMTLSGKFALIATALAIPLAAMLSTVVIRQNSDLSYTRGELAGGPIAHHLQDLAVVMADHRGLSALSVHQPAQHSAALAQAKAAIGPALKELDQQVASQPQLELDKPWNALRSEVLALESSKSTSSAETLQVHTALIQRIHALVDLTAEKTGLLLEPDAAPFILMDMAFVRTSALVEAVARLRGSTGAAIADGSWSTEDSAALTAAKADVARAQLAVQMRMAALERAGATLPPTWREATEAVNAYVNQLDTLGKTGAVQADTTALFKAGSAVLEKIDAFHNGSIEQMDGFLHQRIHRIEQERLQLAGMVALGMLAALYLFLAIRRSIRQSAAASIDAASRLARGDLRAMASATGADEFATVARSFEQIRTSLQNLVAEMNQMSTEHERGDIDVVIDTNKFDGEYRAMAQGINDMVGAHIETSRLAMGVIADFGAGRYDTAIPQLPGKKAIINQTIEQVRGILHAGALSAEENLRIRLALDEVPSAVLIADAQGLIRYANKSVLALLNRIQSDIRAMLPNFDSNRIVGSHFDVFHRNPAHQRQLLEQLKQSHRAQVKFGPNTMRLIATPMFDSAGQRAGTVVEWIDRTAEIRAEEDVTAVVAAAAQGEFSRRIDVNGSEGFFRLLGEHMNNLLGSTEDNLGQMSGALNRIAQGDLTQELDGNYQGVFAQLQADVNKMTRQLVSTISDVNAAAGALTAAAGQVSSTSQSLSQSASEQAASVEETTASLQ
ncbi:MAG: HAMP domain-containing protein, partial [Leptothrix sp. (in: b-proteobacteria)]